MPDAGCRIPEPLHYFPFPFPFPSPLPGEGWAWGKSIPSSSTPKGVLYVWTASVLLLARVRAQQHETLKRGEATRAIPPSSSTTLTLTPTPTLPLFPPPSPTQSPRRSFTACRTKAETIPVSFTHSRTSPTDAAERQNTQNPPCPLPCPLPEPPRRCPPHTAFDKHVLLRLHPHLLAPPATTLRHPHRTSSLHLFSTSVRTAAPRLRRQRATDMRAILSAPPASTDRLRAPGSPREWAGLIRVLLLSVGLLAHPLPIS